MAAQKHTFCRICEPHCPLIAEVDDGGAVVGLSPDLTHPSGGVACHKGLSYLEVHNDPDRLDWPLKRLNPRSEAEGRFVRADWSDALDDIAGRLTTIRAEHGPNAVAVYMGNPFAFNAAGVVMADQFLHQLETDMRFDANTQDSASRVTVNCEVYGSISALMIPDLYRTDYLLLLGGNPKVSRWLAASVPNDNLESIKGIVRRGGKVRFVNPRQVESSTAETGPTLQIRPGADVYFLAAVLHEIDAHEGFDETCLAKHGKNVDKLRAFVRGYPAERVAAVTGLEVAEIKQVAHEIMQARSAVVYAATGVSQSRQGVLTSWLAEMINFCTGNLGRDGGSYKPNGLVDEFPPFGPMKQVETTLGALQLPDPVGFAALPGALLADLIEGGDIKALIVHGGNPLLSIGGDDRLRKAFEKLDLLVTIDIYRSDTAEMCDYVLAATDWLERMDINLLASGGQPVPYVQYTDPMTEPKAGRRNAWWILARLSQAMGFPSPLDDSPDLTDGTELIDSILARRQLSIASLREAPSQTALIDEEPRSSVFERCLQHPDKKVDCCPPRFSASGLFERCSTIFAELSTEPPDTLKLVGLRTPYRQNSWFGNLSLFSRGMRATTPLHMSEHDAATRGLHTGDQITVRSSHGQVETQVLVTDEVRSGTVAMSHGSGHQQAFALRVASRSSGPNYNALAPTGPEQYEPLSHMSWLTGIPVTVEARPARTSGDES